MVFLLILMTAAVARTRVIAKAYRRRFDDIDVILLMPKDCSRAERW